MRSKIGQVGEEGGVCRRDGGSGEDRFGGDCGEDAAICGRCKEGGEGGVKFLGGCRLELTLVVGL